ncbi:uncharacterized protein LOC133899418 [Phragmites australis]|uniref:uncharacterized protein LOC133899418 n=1 Tax=Phragmites australis TaxID=29695 RepID=UPI002D76B688|nr:uncharacterized protein LOC133899418 [Phragmites australis]
MDAANPRTPILLPIGFDVHIYIPRNACTYTLGTLATPYQHVRPHATPITTMAKARATSSQLLRLLVLSLLACLLPARGGGDDGGRCPRVPSMAAERACRTVCGTRPMRDLCLRTLPGARTAVPATSHAMAAARSALDSYAATVAVATSLLDGGAVPDGERAAYGDCMVGYGRARVAMARVADDLAGGCDRAAGLKPGYTAGLRGMDRCKRGLFNYPASPLNAMNLADRNKTLLAALFYSLVPNAM